jgi:hypothetical protein
VIRLRVKFAPSGGEAHNLKGKYIRPKKTLFSDASMKEEWDLKL